MGKREMLLWADALDSGEFEQGHLYLYPPGGGNCCLGVACEIAVRDGVVLEFSTFLVGADEVKGVHGESGLQASYLPEPVQRWLGVDDQNPMLGTIRATRRNDTLKQDFATLAQSVREEAERMS